MVTTARLLLGINNLSLGIWTKYFIAYVVCVFKFFPPSSEIQAGAKLSLNRQFTDEHWSKHRVVTCLDWSLQVSLL